MTMGLLQVAFLLLLADRAVSEAQSTKDRWIWNTEFHDPENVPASSRNGFIHLRFSGAQDPSPVTFRQERFRPVRPVGFGKAIETPKLATNPNAQFIENSHHKRQVSPALKGRGSHSSHLNIDSNLLLDNSFSKSHSLGNLQPNIHSPKPSRTTSNIPDISQLPLESPPVQRNPPVKRDFKPSLPLPSSSPLPKDIPFNSLKDDIRNEFLPFKPSPVDNFKQVSSLDFTKSSSTPHSNIPFTKTTKVSSTFSKVFPHFISEEVSQTSSFNVSPAKFSSFRSFSDDTDNSFSSGQSHSVPLTRISKPKSFSFFSSGSKSNVPAFRSGTKDDLSQGSNAFSKGTTQILRARNPKSNKKRDIPLFSGSFRNVNREATNVRTNVKTKEQRANFPTPVKVSNQQGNFPTSGRTTNQRGNFLTPPITDEQTTQQLRNVDFNERNAFDFQRTTGKYLGRNIVQKGSVRKGKRVSKKTVNPDNLNQFSHSDQYRSTRDEGRIRKAKLIRTEPNNVYSGKLNVKKGIGRTFESWQPDRTPFKRAIGHTIPVKKNDYSESSTKNQEYELTFEQFWQMIAEDLMDLSSPSPSSKLYTVLYGRDEENEQTFSPDLKNWRPTFQRLRSVENDNTEYEPRYRVSTKKIPSHTRITLEEAFDLLNEKDQEGVASIIRENKTYLKPFSPNNDRAEFTEEWRYF